jgi:DNA-binding LytR/AlgR family response regulator
MYKCIIVDDEPHAIDGLKRYIDGIPDLEIVRTFTDSVIALIEITSGPEVDLILLDIDMPGVSGLEIAKEVRHKTKKLVFTTAHQKYGYDAYEADADAFLLKPYSQGKFVVTFNKLFPKKKENEVAGDKANFFFIKSKEESLKLIKVRYKDVVAVESKLNYVQVHTMNGSTTTYMSLSEFSNILMQYEGFAQFQRSFIIAEEYIEHIEGNTIKMVNGTKITVGDFYKKHFQEFVGTKLLKTGRKI